MSNKSGASEQGISLPKGGGSLKGIGETFQPRLFTGTGNFSIPIVTSPGRNGFGPQLTLQYSSGNGNGPFGIGWQLSLPRITRKTEKGLPTYTDQDVFVISSAEDLVPVVNDVSGGPITSNVGNYTVTRYKPRTEGLFARIERWVRNDGDIHWRAITKENVTSIYGKTVDARLFDSQNPHHIFEWLLEETFDAKGNHIFYEYVKENPSLKIYEIYEENRRYNQIYIRRVLYGNTPNTLVNSKKVGPTRIGTNHVDSSDVLERHYLFEVLFDYGDLTDLPAIPFDPAHFPDKPTPDGWPIREDPFSSYRSGFEIRTLRRCRRVLMLHHMDEGEMVGAPLVKSTDFEYDTNEDTCLSTLTDVRVTGYRKHGGTYQLAGMPPVSFKYSEFKPQEQRYQSVTAKGNDLPPRSLNDANFTFMDVFGDALPDMLDTTDTGYYFWRNLGNATLDRRHPQHTMPAGVVLSNPNVAVGDMGGDGLADLVVQTSTMSGFFEATSNGGWKPFKRFEFTPSFNLADPNARLVDLTGDGLSDLLVTQDHHFLWFKCLGEAGYDNPRIVGRRHDLNEFPDVYFNDPSGRVHLADMTGDGLNDIVMVHKGRVDYWPNLGYGQFGRRITLANAPHFDYNFDPRRLFLVDLDGTGCTDLVYVDTGSVHFWFNQSGNGWSDEQIIHGTPYVSDLSAIQFADFFGTGTSSLVWSYDYNFQPGGNYKVLDFCGGVKPHLLIEMSNNMGATTRVQYAPSTKFYLEDKANAEPWVTNLPFPVQVVEKTEVIDHISKTKLITTYKYHHGYYDGREREFRGFGRVDQYDTEEFEDFVGSSLHDSATEFNNDQRSYYVPPILTKTWFHTGVYFDENLTAANGEYYGQSDMMMAYEREFYQGDSRAFDLDDHNIDKHETPHEAYRAMRGSMIRTEVYGLDGTREEVHPYTVTDHRYRVTRLQAKHDNSHAVYLPVQKETLSYHYERDPDDPRVAHQLTLGVDDYGNITDKVSIAYPRRIVPTDLPEQGELQVIYTHTDFINKEEDPAYYYAGVTCQTRSYEITGIDWHLGQPQLNPDNFAGIIETSIHADVNAFQSFEWRRPHNHTPIEKRIIEWSRTYFRSDADPDQIDAIGDLSHRLALGEIELLALSYETYQVALTDDLLAEIYEGRTNAVDLPVYGGYHPHANHPTAEDDAPGYWWIPSGRQSFDPQKFYQPTVSQDPFSQRTRMSLDDYGLLLQSVEDAVHNTITAQNDYRVLQPYQLEDPNGNRTQVTFDALGLVVATVVMGKLRENKGDYFDNTFKPDLTLGEIQDFVCDPRVESTSLLHTATTRIIYDLDRYQRCLQPPFAATLAREIHAKDPGGDQSPIQISFTYSDGFGREIQTKLQSERGDAPEREPDVTLPSGDIQPGPLVFQNGEPRQLDTDHRWIGKGRTIYNNKGKAVKQYEPFFSNTHLCEPEREMTDTGVSPILCYDPLERVICTIHPNHTYEKVVFGPWHQKTWDVNDTIHPKFRFDPTIGDLPDGDFDPTDDPHVGSFFQELAADQFLPTWYQLRMDQARALAEWPDSDVNGNAIPENAYRRQAERRAAEKAAKHCSTPTVTYLDTQGRAFLTVEDNGKDDLGQDVLYRTRTELDIEGNDLSITDPRNIQSFTHAFDIAGRKVRVDSVDAGVRFLLPNVVGNPIYAWDANGHEVTTVYDALQRPIELRVKEGGHEYLKEKTIYGDDPTLPAAQNINHRGKIWKVYDGAGLIISNEYDFKGGLLEQSRRLLLDGKAQAQWPIGGDIFVVAQANALLEPNAKRHTIHAAYDALNRVIRNVTPDGTVQEPVYNEANLLESLNVTRSGKTEAFVKNIDYNAKGQRTRIEYGNGVITHYTYDLQTYRLSHILTRRGGTLTPKTLQNIHYTYDPVGNITEIRDDAHPRVFHANNVIDPESRYTYDAVYRLIEAMGREHESMTACHYQTKGQKHTEYFNFQPPSNAQALGNYLETYVYDESGNMVRIEHTNLTRDTGWTRAQSYEVDDPALPPDQQTPISNRIFTSRAGCQDEDTFTYPHDPNGNITKMPHLPDMIWDFKDQLVEVQLNVGQNPNRAYYQYDASGQRVRKTVVKNNGSVVEERVYLGGYEIYKSHNATGITLRRDTVHVMDDKHRIALIEVEKNPATGQETNNRVRYQLANHLGSAILELDDSDDADIISYEEYYPYGGTAYLAGRNETEAKRKRYRYSGKEKDNETGLYYYGARYYAPWLGRWCSTDPAWLIDGVNIYAFTRDNPIRLIDPSGEASTEDTFNSDVIIDNTDFDNLDAEYTEEGGWDFGAVGESPPEQGVPVPTINDFLAQRESEERFGTYSLPSQEDIELSELRATKHERLRDTISLLPGGDILNTTEDYLTERINEREVAKAFIWAATKAILFKMMSRMLSPRITTKTRRRTVRIKSNPKPEGAVPGSERRIKISSSPTRIPRTSGGRASPIGRYVGKGSRYQLSLDPIWGNTATNNGWVLPKPGTIAIMGKVAPLKFNWKQPSSLFYRGGARQYFFFEPARDFQMVFAQGVSSWTPIK